MLLPSDCFETSGLKCDDRLFYNRFYPRCLLAHGKNIDENQSCKCRHIQSLHNSFDYNKLLSSTWLFTERTYLCIDIWVCLCLPIESNQLMNIISRICFFNPYRFLLFSFWYTKSINWYLNTRIVHRVTISRIELNNWYF